jgi:hypothetical protein
MTFTNYPGACADEGLNIELNRRLPPPFGGGGCFLSAPACFG